MTRNLTTKELKLKNIKGIIPQEYKITRIYTF